MIEMEKNMNQDTVAFLCGFNEGLYASQEMLSHSLRNARALCQVVGLEQQADLAVRCLEQAQRLLKQAAGHLAEEVDTACQEIKRQEDTDRDFPF